MSVLVPALQIVELSKSYNNQVALDRVSFEIQPGEIFGLLGPNGAGKTTLISIVTTLTLPDFGDVRVFGQSLSNNSIEVKKQVGVVPQEIVNHGYFSVEEILEFQSGYYGLLRNRERIDYLLKRLDLHPHRTKKVKQLSGGMKRRLMIAKALVHNPRLLLLDEPTAGVDIELRSSLWDFVCELRASGVAVLLTTHYLEEAQRLCDRVGVIHKGVLQKVGKTKDLIQELAQKKVSLVLVDGKQPAQLKELKSSVGGVFEYIIGASEQVGGFLARAQIESRDILDIQIQEGTLEDAFLQLIQAEKKGATL